VKDTGAPVWEVSPLGEVTDKIGSGATPKGGKTAYKREGISLIRSLNVHDLDFRYEDLAKIDDEQAEGLSNVVVEARDVLLNITGASIARCTQVPADVLPARVNQHVAILRPILGVLDSRFLAYLLVSKETKDQLLNIGDKAGATRQALTKAQLQTFQIPVPSLEEQKRIVAVLDQAFAALDRARALAEANLADSEELFQAFKSSLMEHPGGTTEKVTLAQVATIESKLVDPRDPLNLDLPHLGAGNMISGSDVLVDVQTAREEGLKSGKHHFDSQTVLYSKIRPYLMKVARPDFDGLCSADVYPLTPAANLDRNYLFHLLLGRNFTDYAISGSDRAGMPKVNRNHLFSYSFDMPEMAIQINIAERIDSAMQLRQSLSDAYSAKLAEIAKLRQSLLQKAFSGQLT